MSDNHSLLTHEQQELQPKSTPKHASSKHLNDASGNNNFSGKSQFAKTNASKM